MILKNLLFCECVLFDGYLKAGVYAKTPYKTAIQKHVKIPCVKRPESDLLKGDLITEYTEKIPEVKYLFNASRGNITGSDVRKLKQYAEVRKNSSEHRSLGHTTAIVVSLCLLGSSHQHWMTFGKIPVNKTHIIRLNIRGWGKRILFWKRWKTMPLERKEKKIEK